MHPKQRCMEDNAQVTIYPSHIPASGSHTLWLPMKRLLHTSVCNFVPVGKPTRTVAIYLFAFTVAIVC